VEAFSVLQGDVIRTSSAYHLGTRIDDGTYVVASSSCDLVQGRRRVALLLPIDARRASDVAGRLDNLTLFEPTRYFYLPVLPDDDADIVCNVAHLDPLHVISNEEVNGAMRVASLSLVGWRIFGTLAREILIREADQEDLMRTAPAPWPK
jgi:hypothetical protein